MKLKSLPSKTHAIVLTAYAIQVVFALEVDVHVGAMNFTALIHIYAAFHVLMR